MAELFYREERDQDFFNTCEEVRRKANKNLSVAEIVSKAIFMPAGSFYIHPREYANIIRKGKSNLPKSKTSRALHLEILNRYTLLKQEYPTLKEEEINKKLSVQSAPRFYLSISRAIILYYKLLKK